MKVYIAAPLFSEAERVYNEGLRSRLEGAGFQVFLPQEGCPGPADVFECCVDELKECDVLVAVLDGPQVDDGTAFECGLAYAFNIPVVGLRTDYRRVGEHGADINLMLQESAKKICLDIQEVIEALRRL